MIKTLAAAAAALLLTAASAGAQEAVWSDPVAVRQALGQGDDPLLAGLLAAFELRDEAATEALSTFLSRDGGDPEAREAASTALALVHLRTGRYADAAALLEGVLARFEGSADRRRGLEQTLGVARALAAAPAQRRGPFGAGSTPFSRDMAGLPRVPVTINGQTREYVFDTGAMAWLAQAMLASR